MITKIEGTCAYEDCKEPAELIACGRRRFGSIHGHPDAACYCPAHAMEVRLEDDPEYTEECPNCACQFGVN